MCNIVVYAMHKNSSASGNQHAREHINAYVRDEINTVLLSITASPSYDLQRPTSKLRGSCQFVMSTRIALARKRLG